MKSNREKLLVAITLFRKVLFRIGRIKNLVKGKYKLKSSFERLDIRSFMNSIDQDITTETYEECKKIEKEYMIFKSGCDITLGGGGPIELIYFMIRKYALHSIVECGVALGFSSYAALNAIQKNNSGRLYSSDLPYPLINNSEAYIGAIIPKELKDNWKLCKSGDMSCINESNLKEYTPIDLFIYDSSKHYPDKIMTFKKIVKLLSCNSWVIIDDIGDDIFFEDTCKTLEQSKDYWVFFDGKKYYGLISGKSIKSLEMFSAA